MRAHGGTRGGGVGSGGGGAAWYNVTGFLSSASIEISEQLCELHVWMTSWLRWQFSAGRLQRVCVPAEALRVLFDLLPSAQAFLTVISPPPILAEAPRPFGREASAAPFFYSEQMNEALLLNVLQAGDTTAWCASWSGKKKKKYVFKKTSTRDTGSAETQR